MNQKSFYWRQGNGIDSVWQGCSCDLRHFWISEDRLAWAHTQRKQIWTILSWSDLQSSELSPRPSLSLPDDIEDLDHLLVDDENYGNIQADAAETWDCSFVEAADWRKERNGKKM